MGKYLDVHKELVEELFDIAPDLATLDLTYSNMAYRRIYPKLTALIAKLKALRSELQEESLTKRTPRKQ